MKGNDGTKKMTTCTRQAKLVEQSATGSGCQGSRTAAVLARLSVASRLPPGPLRQKQPLKSQLTDLHGHGGSREEPDFQRRCSDSELPPDEGAVRRPEPPMQQNIHTAAAAALSEGVTSVLSFQIKPSNRYKPALQMLVLFLCAFRTKLPQKACLCWVSPSPQKRRKEAPTRFSISTTSRLCFTASERRTTARHRGTGCTPTAASAQAQSFMEGFCPLSLQNAFITEETGCSLSPRACHPPAGH